MHEALIWVLVWAAGAGLGVVFFGGLWWTVRKSMTSRYPALWIFGSMILRTAVVLAGFYIVSGPHWERLLLCLLGFVMARMGVIRRTRSADENETPAGRESDHAT